MKKVFLKDIAKDLNISKTAVSLVLNDKGDENKISKGTQKRILDYAKKHNYVPNQLARGLSRGKSETIGLIIPNISDTFYSMMAVHIEKKAKDLGYIVIFSCTYEDHNKEAELIRSMLNRQVDGLIIASTQENQKEIEELKKMNFPFVLVDRNYPKNKTDYVIVDNFDGMKMATEHLLKLGRKKVGFITLKSNLEVIKQRQKGYEQALKDFNIKPSKKRVKELNRESFDQEMTIALHELLEGNNTIDAIVFTTHFLTAVGIRELKKMNVDIPAEIAIVSFSELSAFDLVEPPITSIILPVADIGNKAVDILINKIEGKEVKMINDVLDTQLVIRKSCGV